MGYREFSALGHFSFFLCVCKCSWLVARDLALAFQLYKGTFPLPGGVGGARCAGCLNCEGNVDYGFSENVGSQQILCLEASAVEMSWSQK